MNSKKNLKNLFIFFCSIQQTSPLYPPELVQLRGALDPQICPDNSEIIAYILLGDIWVINMVSGHTKRLTNTHDANRSFGDNPPLSAGVPSYVMQEEFSRYQGFWWQPESDGMCWFTGFQHLFPTKINDKYFQMAFIASYMRKSTKVMFCYLNFHHHSRSELIMKNIDFHVPDRRMQNPN